MKARSPSPVTTTTNMSESDDDHPECVSEGIVNGSITYNISNTVATFTPLCKLAYGTTYTATITGTQQSVLAEPMSWSFTTIAQTPDTDEDGVEDGEDQPRMDRPEAAPERDGLGGLGGLAREGEAVLLDRAHGAEDATGEPEAAPLLTSAQVPK